MNKPAIQTGVCAGTADDSTAYQRKSSPWSPQSVAETPTVLRRIKEKAPCFSAGMNPTRPSTNHRQ